MKLKHFIEKQKLVKQKKYYNKFFLKILLSRWENKKPKIKN